jgi:hypothetical protein
MFTKMCAARKNNQNWKLRKQHGRKKLFETPELLWEKACEYFEWAEANPWEKCKSKETNGKMTETEETILGRPFSLDGFRQYIGASTIWWYKFHDRCKRESDTGFLEVMERIKLIIETQQFEGACIGVFNSNIIARQLGLTDKKYLDHTNGGKKFKGFNFPSLTVTNTDRS